MNINPELKPDKHGLTFMQAAPENIWSYEQNNPNLVVEDLVNYYPDIDPKVVMNSLMARGVTKWLKVRRDLIAHKKSLKHEVKRLLKEMQDLKKELTAKYCTVKQVENGEKTPFELSMYYQVLINFRSLKGQLAFTMKERATLKALCMTERWQDWTGKSVEDMNTLKASD